MKVIASTKYGDFNEVLQELEAPVPSPAPRDLVVRVRAIATNPIDYKRIVNFGNVEAEVEKKPFIAGWDCSGVVEAVGSETSLFKVGDEVMFAGSFTRDGCFAELVAVDERIVGRKPKNLDDNNSASVPLCFLTVYESMVEQLNIPIPPTPEDREANKAKHILITAGAGGVGSIAIQFASKVLGLTVIATASRPESVEWCHKMGATHVIDHTQPFLPQLQTLSITGVEYALCCYDLDKQLTELSTVVKPLGAICGIFVVGTNMAQVDWFTIFIKRITVTFEFMYTRDMFQVEPEKQGQALNLAADLLEAGTITSTLNQSFPYTLDGVKAALDLQRSGKAVGKIGLTL